MNYAYIDEDQDTFALGRKVRVNDNFPYKSSGLIGLIGYIYNIDLNGKIYIRIPSKNGPPVRLHCYLNVNEIDLI